MDERLRFVARLLEGEKMAPLCAEFGISRKTGYKIFDRYKDTGVTAFTDRSRRPYRQANRPPAATVLTRPTHPNALWCADYKGEFMLGNRRYCYPLTITDFASRYLLTCEALSTTQERFAFTAFDRAFRDFGLPRAIRTDNGVPFAGPTA
jgi:putative transposase